MKCAGIIAGVAVLATATSAFVVPTPSFRVTAKTGTALNGAGKYDNQLWDKAAKDDVASTYDASQPWSETNFDPYTKDAKGNACDPNGYYPGEGKYKDPIRPQVSFEDYLKDRAAKEAGN